MSPASPLLLKDNELKNYDVGNNELKNVIIAK